MLTLATTLNYYKRKDIQKILLSSSQNKEVAIKFGDKFGKRPEILKYPNDILELAKQGATSFHVSEELWSNPLQLSPELKETELHKLRIGWDLVIDIDAPWIISKIASYLIIKALKDFDISSVSVKFSGNKGFHIGIPFEAFPKNFKDKETKNLFPEAPRNIAKFLLEYICNKYIKISNDKILFDNIELSLTKLKKITGKTIDELTITKPKSLPEFVCKCGYRKHSEVLYMKCPKCGKLMEKFSVKTRTPFRKFNPSAIINIDTILISSRHLYRMPYSLHEKTGLVSLPISPDNILTFKKEEAKPEMVKVKLSFLDRNIKYEEASILLEKAYKTVKLVPVKTSYKLPSDAISEKFFPPCIKNILVGLEDGRKRSVFILLNFLTMVGWGYEQIEQRLYEWNKKNREPLRETYIKGQIRYHKQRKKMILPPNCDNTMYYKDIGVCNPDTLCQKIKNPVNYCIKRA